jgi:hypothetical protein
MALGRALDRAAPGTTIASPTTTDMERSMPLDGFAPGAGDAHRLTGRNLTH